MKLFRFYDGVEDILLVAKDANDAFDVVGEHLKGTGMEHNDVEAALDELIMARLAVYEDDSQLFPFVGEDKTTKIMKTPSEIVAEGRRVVRWVIY